MNSIERERILQLVSEGILRPEEAAKLLAALTPPTPPTPSSTAESPLGKQKEKDKAKEKEPEKEKAATMEVQLQRPDGTYYTVQLPTSLVPMIVKIAGVSIRESMRTASQEAWDGFKTMTKNKANEVKTNVKDKFSGKKAEAVPEVPVAASASTPPKPVSRDERQLILQMVQNGRISAEEASRLISQIDAAR